MGLHDFYDDPPMDLLDAVMDTSNAIRPEDMVQLRAIYFHHGSH